MKRDRIGAALAALPAFAIVLVAGAGGAEAHIHGAHGAGLVDGVAHPFGGFDHLLAMVAVGLWAAQIGGRALWRLPAAFVAVMAMGGFAGAAWGSLPMVEIGIAGSVLALGLFIALATRPSLALGVAIVGGFALFHGGAHGSELPQAAAPWGLCPRLHRRHVGLARARHRSRAPDEKPRRRRLALERRRDRRGRDAGAPRLTRCSPRVYSH